MLIIKNIQWIHGSPTPETIIRLTDHLRKRLRMALIDVKLTCTDTEIQFTNMTESKLAVSRTENYRHLTKGDARIKTLGRKYLMSKDLTKEQYDFMFNLIQDTMDGLLLTGNIVLTLNNSTDIILRDGRVKYAPPEKRSYPVDHKP